MKILRSPDPAGGNLPEPSTDSPPPAPSVGSPPAPPAAQAVASGSKSERELQLAQELEAERKQRKDREQRINQLEDENHQLKTVKRDKPAKANSGWTMLDFED